MVTKAKKPLTNAEKLELRRQELDYFAQVQQQRDEQRAAHDAEHAEFMARVEARRGAREKALNAAVETAERKPDEDYYAFKARIEQEAIDAELVEQAPVIPTLNGIYQAKAEQERLEAEEAERQRIASLDPRDVLISALSPEKKAFIEKWEAANKGLQFPLEALTMH